MTAGSRRSGARRSGVVYTALSLAIVVIVAALAITASQTPPPAIAELSPDHVEPIKDAPPEQASELGSAEGGAGIGGLTTTSMPPTTQLGAPVTLPIAVPRLRRCVGQPPRQTEDPQSPPCVASWAGGDNGGATSKGVTTEEIRVAVPLRGPELNRHARALEAHFNKRYEMYGRKLRLVPYKGAGDLVSCAVQQSDAIKVDEQLDAFASVGYLIQRGSESCYYDELARRGVISTQMSVGGPPSAGEAHLARFAPFQWNYLPTTDKVLQSIGEVLCKNLSGSAPVHASGAQRAATVRTFGLIKELPLHGAAPLDTTPLDTITRACGISFVSTELDGNAESGERSNLARQAILKMKEGGVTSVVCVCEATFLGFFLMPNATQEAYYPEWVVQDYQAQDQEVQVNQWAQTDQKTQVFGVRTWNKQLARQDMPYWQAIRDVDPTFPPEPFVYGPVYWELLLLASGIQAAGPHLTPQSFQSGLLRTTFPNPDCGGPPYYQACVGFSPTSHSMIQDVTLVWFNPNAPPRETDPSIGGPTVGAYCYVDGGRRYKPGQVPAGPRAFFEGPCL
jgi:hypothetical protein